MHISFETSKNGELTAVVDKLYLHSSYNPSKEAERFVTNIKISYIPSIIVLLEPALSYIVPFLKKRFPDSKIVTIRYTNYFDKFNNADYTLYYSEHKFDFEKYLFNFFGEEKILTSLILQWQPSSKIFYEIDNKILLIMKSLMEKSKTLLVTREFFEKKWLINSCNFIKYLSHPIILNKKISKPIVIVSSGPSLNDSLNLLRNYKNKIFIICLSSAIKLCVTNGITPDLCMSTDGGFWAGEHLKILQSENIPLALPLEGFCPKKVLKNNKILPLLYNDGISRKLAEKSGIPFMHGERNGTVSGTALIFALENSNSKIYFCGLDMSSQRGFQHCQPNEIELTQSINDYKLRSKEQRISSSEYSKGVLSIYKEWFDFLDLQGRKVYRVINKKYKKNTLGCIKDMTQSDFEKELCNISISDKKEYFKEINYEKKLTELKNFIINFSGTEQWKKNIYPLSATSLIHNPDNADITRRLEKEQFNLLKKIENIFNE